MVFCSWMWPLHIDLSLWQMNFRPYFRTIINNCTGNDAWRCLKKIKGPLFLFRGTLRTSWYTMYRVGISYFFCILSFLIKMFYSCHIFFHCTHTHMLHYTHPQLKFIQLLCDLKNDVFLFTGHCCSNKMHMWILLLTHLCYWK